jgi:long-chain acyl-CoA synthetase
MSIALFKRISDHAATRPNAPALLWGTEGRMSYAQLAQRVECLSAHLSNRYSASQTILLQSRNSPGFVVWFLACLQAGMRVFPLSSQLHASEMRSAAIKSGAIAIAEHHETTDLDESLGIVSRSIARSGFPVPVRRQLPGILLQSSGTTGLPRIVFRDAISLDAVARNVAVATHLKPEDRVLGIVPMFHSYGVENALLAPLWAGSTLVIADLLESHKVPAMIEAIGITVLPAVPFLYELLASDVSFDPRLKSIRLAYSAGASLPRRVHDAFFARFGKPIGQLFGATELGSLTFHHPDPQGLHEPGVVGLPMQDVSIRVLDSHDPSFPPLAPGVEGQIAIRSTSMYSACIDGQIDQIDNHVLTGDLGFIDASGRLVITGRLKFLIDVGGAKVNPMEVETVLKEHPAIADAVIVPIPMTQTADRIKAVVTLRSPQSPFSADELKEYARGRLSGFKVPRVVEIRESLPRTATGKVIRSEL